MFFGFGEIKEKKLDDSMDGCEAFRSSTSNRDYGSVINMAEVEDIGKSIWASMMEEMEMNNQREVSINQIIKNI